MNKSFSIVGSGFAALASALALSEQGRVTLYDRAPFQGASGVAAGLLHPYVGKMSQLNWRGKESLKEAKELLSEECTLFQGIYRVSSDEEMLKRFFTLSQKEPLVHWIDPQKVFPFVKAKGGIYIEEGVAVATSLYLKHLWSLCEKRGVSLVTKNITSLYELPPEDKVVVCPGAWGKTINECSHVPITKVKGQLLTMRWPKSLPPLTSPLIGDVYIVPTGDTVVVGSTYEKGFLDETADLESAKKLILPRLQEMIPEFNDSHILSCSASLRASCPGHLPLVKEIPRGLIVTGLGSKGLLYHAYLGKKVADFFLM